MRTADGWKIFILWIPVERIILFRGLLTSPEPPPAEMQ